MPFQHRLLPSECSNDNGHLPGPAYGRLHRKFQSRQGPLDAEFFVGVLEYTHH